MPIINFPYLSLTGDHEPNFLRRVAESVNAVINGHHKATGEFTLTANQTSTVVDDSRIGTGTVIVFSPTTANAAAALATTYISAVTANQFTVTHASAVSTDRTFKYTVNGR